MHQVLCKGVIIHAVCTRVNALGKWRHFISPAKKGFLPISSHRGYWNGLIFFIFPLQGWKQSFLHPSHIFPVKSKANTIYDCKHEFTFDLLVTWLFPFSLCIPLYSIFHYQYLFFTPLLYYFPINPSCLFASLLSFIPFWVPSIPSLLSLYLSLGIQPLSGFSEAIVLFSCLDCPFSDSPFFPVEFFQNLVCCFSWNPKNSWRKEPKHSSKL